MSVNSSSLFCFGLRGGAGFSLVEIIASMAVLSVAALGITAAWRLADEKAMAVRLDDRAARILKEYYELQTFAPDYLFESHDASSMEDPDLSGHPLNPGESRKGFLYHPVKPGQAGAGNQYEDKNPFTILLATDGGSLTLTYQSEFVTNNQSTLRKEITLIPRNSPK